MDLTVFISSVLNVCHTKGGPVWEDETIGCQPLVMDMQHSIEHALTEETVTHPLADNDVHFLHKQLHLLHLALDDGHL